MRQVTGLLITEEMELGTLIPLTEEDSIPEKDIVNPIERNNAPQKKAEQLDGLSTQSKPVFDNLAKEIDKQALTTEVDRKDRDKILAKAQRPEIKKSKPWFDVEHIRDSLRFRTRIEKFEDVKEICKLLVGKKFEFVKVDLAKMFRPKAYGWRFAAVDLRSPRNKQLVEYYMSFAELIQVNETVAHDLYEKWREIPGEEQKARYEEVEHDMAASRAAFDSAWAAALDRLGISRHEAELYWNSISEAIRGRPKSC